jgi:hypothetical protein
MVTFKHSSIAKYAEKSKLVILEQQNDLSSWHLT